MDVLLRRFLRAGVRRGLAGNWYWFLLAGSTFIPPPGPERLHPATVSSVTARSRVSRCFITVRDRQVLPPPLRQPEILRPCGGTLAAGSVFSSSTPRTADTC